MSSPWAKFHRALLSAPDQHSCNHTIRELADEHNRWFNLLVRKGIRGDRTQEDYDRMAQRHLAADLEFATLPLSKLTSPACQGFLDRLLERSGSPDLVKRARRTLVTWCKFGQRKGWLMVNPAQACKVEAPRVRDEDEHFALPSKEDLAAILRAAGEGEHAARDTAVVRLLMFGGLRISELLGLADDRVVLGGRSATLRVRERLCRRYVKLDPPKSAKARRDVPVGQQAALAVRAWRMARGVSQTFLHKGARAPGRLFPHPEGRPLWDYNHFIRQCWNPLMRRAGLLDWLPDAKGVLRAVCPYSPHHLRHVAASLWIEQGLPPKKVQELLGHATLQLTMDIYGHLWVDAAVNDALAQASERLIPLVQ